MNTNEIPIVLMTDNNYVMPTLVLLQSMYKNKNKDSYYKIFVLCDGIKNNDAVGELKNFSKDNFDVVVLEIDNPYKDFVNTANPYMTNTTFLKFEIPNILKSYDKILYMDVDVLVLQDLKTMYDTDLGNTYAGVIKDLYVHELFDGEKELGIKTYFNAGVMLLNAKKIREEDLNKKMAEYYIQNSAKLIFHDQSVMNKMFNENITLLPPKYDWIVANMDYSKYKLKNFYNIKNINEVKKDICIIHYCRFKPWKLKNFEFSEQWLKYYRELGLDERLLNLKTCYITILYCWLRGHLKLKALDNFIRKIRYKIREYK